MEGEPTRRTAPAAEGCGKVGWLAVHYLAKPLLHVRVFNLEEEEENEDVDC